MSDSRNLRRKISASYIITCVVIVCLMTVSLVFSLINYEREQVGPYLVNIAGKQRMLSQRIAYLSTLLQHETAIIERESIKLELSNNADTFMNNHLRLTGQRALGDNFSDIVYQPTQAIYDHYFSREADSTNLASQQTLDEEVQRYYATVRNILGTPSDFLVEDINLELASNLLTRLDSAATLFESEYSRQLKAQRNMDIVIWFVVMLAVLLAVLFLFHPLQRMVMEQFAAAKRAREAAERERQNALNANKAKANFLAKMSHEFRTPVSAIISVLDLIGHSNKPQGDVLHKGELACHRLLQLTNNLLDTINADVSEASDTVEQFDLIKLLDVCLSPMASQCRDKHLDFDMQCDTALPQYVAGYPQAMAKVIGNVLDNAVKFTDKGSVFVKVNLQVVNKQYLLTLDIVDTGIGIHEDDHELIFEQFTQLSEGETRRYPGAGIGLTVARHQAERVGGSVTLSSQQDVGSQFTLSFPLQPVKYSAPVPHKSNDCVFAVVDDLPISRQHLSNIIRMEGYDVDTYSSGTAILAERDKIASYQGIFTDLYMPGLDGLELSRTIHALMGDKSPPVVLISSAPTANSIARTNQDTIWQAFVKPIDKNRFIDCLHQLAKANVSSNKTRRQGQILLVEDELINAELMESMLQNMGHKVVHAANGTEALKAGAQHIFDVILMDINLPDISGLMVAEQLREKGVNCPIIAVTANAFEADKIATRKVGMRYHLTKPVGYEELENTLRTAMSLNS